MFLFRCCNSSQRLQVIAEKADIQGSVAQALTVENYATSRSADSYPRFRPCWLVAERILAAGFYADAADRTAWRNLVARSAALAVALCTTNRRPTADKYQSRPATAGFSGWTKASAESVLLDTSGQTGGINVDTGDSLLSRYAKNMTEDARRKTRSGTVP
jgi:type VI secretion system protein VasG